MHGTSSRPLFALNGRTIAVTGGAEGLGRCMSEALANAGADIIVTSRTLRRATRAAAEISGTFGGGALGVRLDQCDPASVARFARTAWAWHGRIDVLLNNAGGHAGSGRTDLFRRSWQAIDATITTNLTGVLYCCQQVGVLMARQGFGKIINVASISGLIGRSRAIYHRNKVREPAVDYAAAKAGIIGLTRDLAACLAPYHIQVNTLSPGGFDRGRAPKSFVVDFGRLTPLGRMGRPVDELNGAIVFLASSASDYVTGHNLVVDGGFSAIK